MNWQAMQHQLSQWIVALGNAPLFSKAIFVFVLGTWGWAWLKPRYERHLQKRAASWPETIGRVVGREVKEERSRHSVTGYLAILDYTYVVEGDRTGRHRRRFETQNEAESWLDQLYEKEISVRYNRSRPSQSVVLDRELPAPIVNNHEALEGYDLLNNNEDTPWNPALMWAAALGLVVEAVIHFNQLAGHGVANKDAFVVLFVMQVYVIAVCIAVSYANRSTAAGVASKRFRSALEAVTPQGVAWLGRAIMIYGSVWFGWIWVRGFLFNAKDDDGRILCMFTAFQAIFLFEAYRTTQYRRWKRESLQRL